MVRQILPTALVAAAALAAPAAAAPPALGVLEHRVIEVFEASPPAGMDRHRRVEHFVARDRDRAIVVDGQGRITDETVKNGTDLRTFDGMENRLVLGVGIAGRNFVPSRSDEGENEQRLIDDGTLRVDGETTWNGRAALRVVVAVAAERPGHEIVHVLDRTTKQLLETTERSPAGEVTFRRTLVLDEDLPLDSGTARLLEMSPHPRAQVTATAARKRIAAKAKAKPRARNRTKKARR